MSGENLKRTASFGRLLMLFTAILLLFLALTSSQTLMKLKNDETKNFDLKLKSSLDQVIARTSEESFIHDRFNEIISVTNKKGIESPELSEELRKMETFYGTTLKCFFYKDLEFVKSGGESPDDLDFFSELMKKMHLKGENFKLAQRQVHQEIMKRFGPGHRLELLVNDKNELWRFKSLERDNYFFWSSYDNGIAVFLIATSFPEFVERFSIIKESLGLKNVGAGNPKQKKYSAPDISNTDQMRAARIKAGLTGKDTVAEFGKRWAFIEDEAGLFYCVASSGIESQANLIAIVHAIFILSSVLCIGFMILYILSFFNKNPGIGISDWLDSISIRYRILGLFSMASIFPVLFTTLIGATSISERIEIIENQVSSESISNLYRLEKMISEKLEQSEIMANQIRKLLTKEPANEEFFQKNLDHFGLPRFLSRLEVRDGDGNTLFSTDDREVHGVAEAMDMFSRVALKMHAPARMGKKANLVTPAEIVSESVLSTDELGMATILRQRARQWAFKMGTFPTIWYWDVFPELATGAAFMHYTAQIITIYQKQVHETLQQRIKEKDNILLSTQLNYHFNTFKIEPKIEGIKENQLLDAAIVSMRTGKVVFRDIEIAGIPFWLTIKPEKNISSHVFFNLISKPGKLAVLDPLKVQLATSGILALIVSLVGALLIIRLFISPIGGIAEGISAIRERKHEFRIPIRRKDEFGTLSTAFNTVIEELKELEYGRIVQTSLLPSKIPVPPGYDLACFRASATDLAGDYHDVLPLTDGRTAIILGDVTGHGISAALAMAMAKATVDYMSLEGESFPGPLMDKLNALFNKELKPRHKFMTLVTLVLDPETGVLEVDNAGQSYPYYFVAKKNSAEEIQIPSMPLGATKKRRAKPESVTMQSGDAVILYSDGIIECTSPEGEMFGYDRFMEVYVELLKQHPSADEVLNKMIERLDSFRKSGPLPDDITLVMLRKL